MKKILIIVGAVLLVLILAAIILPLVFINPLVKAGVENAGPMVAKVDTKLGSASISIFSGRGTLRALVVGNPQGYKQPNALKADEITIGVQPKSLFGDKIIINTVRVISPEITFEGGPKKNNFTKILENVQAFTGGGAKGAQAGGPGKKLQVDEVVISGARVTATTLLSGGQPVTLTLPDIHLTALGTGPEGITAADLTAVMLKELSGKIVSGMADNLAKLGSSVVDSAASAAGKEAQKGAESLTKDLGNLLKKGK